MNQYNNPRKSDWKSLVTRPYVDNSLIYETVIDVFKSVKENGDVSLRELTKKFDKVELKNIKVEIDEIDVSWRNCSFIFYSFDAWYSIVNC